MQSPGSLILLALLVVAAPGPAAAQATTARPGDPARARPAHERLAVFEGTWRALDPADPGFQEVCSWLHGGRRHMICRSRRQTPTGHVEQQVAYSYRGRDSTYIVTAFLPTGQVWRYLGRPEADRWTFDLQGDVPGNAQRLRMVVTVAADTIRFVEESSEDGGPWRVTEDYRHVRVRSP